jgi:hypothetical protein
VCERAKYMSRFIIYCVRRGVAAQVFILTCLCGSVRQQLRSVSLGDFELGSCTFKIKGLNNLRRVLLLRPVRKAGLAV